MNLVPAQIFLTDTAECVGEVLTAANQQPGSFVEVSGALYAVLERRHRYSLRLGRYRLDGVTLYVQPAEGIEEERTFFEGQWVIGEPDCIFNARSPLIRCAPNPSGPCQGCRYYESQNEK
ncbi:DUF6464 family protein [Gloeobacter kilaueensis]|uniref:Uncharacterized protein n=1 Tax=Gloeobacter kilaueensis (strain ATCC BAA-2537 / CCAP 1431/1 / ULC 316 / JS1) TaxID=1183438 RepID=U5QF29_GLOK1|nr:DUF6464 family protein [Gloeobacter kilaueensis]AGY57567.1 hypothetical protein GKIL_1321 [Gloeobacter kilaueensis JS1]